MKKILLFALMAAAVVGCKRSADTPQDDPNEQSGVIALGTGMSIGRAANEGIRADFEEDDQIGVFAAYDAGTIGSETGNPSWNDPTTPIEFEGVYFKNIPAMCTAAGDAQAPSPAKFAWGADGSGGVANDQLYPKKNRPIYLYAYYPYAADSTKIDQTAGPKVSYILDTLNPLKQPDVLWAIGKSKAGEDSISRKDALDVLHFNHALAQINFTLYKAAGVGRCELVEIQLTVPALGTVTLTGDGTTSNIGLVGFDGSKKSNGTYKIKADGVDTNVATGEIKEWDGTTPADRPDALLTTPYMIWPLTKAEAAACKMKVTVYFGATSAGSDGTNVKSFDIDMSQMSEIKQGKLNFFRLGITPTVINLEGTIEPWDETNGSDSGLTIE